MRMLNKLLALIGLSAANYHQLEQNRKKSYIVALAFSASATFSDKQHSSLFVAIDKKHTIELKWC